MHETYDNKLEARQWFTMYVTVIFIGASLSEPHIDRTSGLARGPGNDTWYDRHPRRSESRQEVAHMLASASFTVSLEPVAV